MSRSPVVLVTGALIGIGRAITVRYGRAWARGEEDHAPGDRLGKRGQRPLVEQVPADHEHGTGGQVGAGDNAFLHELELDIRAELTLAETGQPYEEAVRVPIDEWLSDPADNQRYEFGLRSLLGAVEALEDGSGPGRCTETEPNGERLKHPRKGR